jgi:phosphohistidine phosphatase
MRIFLCRHGDAPDRLKVERVLSEKGYDEAARLGEKLASCGVKIDNILCSPKERATQTAKVLAGCLGTEIAFEDLLTPQMSTDAIAAFAAKYDDWHADIVAVGHWPDLNDLCAAFLMDASKMPEHINGTAQCLVLEKKARGWYFVEKLNP